MCEDTGGGKKKSQGKHGAVTAPYVKPESKVAVSRDWEDDCASAGQSKSECVNHQLDDEIIDTDVVIGPGGEVDNLD
ncbi:hypothetical protein DSO57_1019749 [Entomophthora muscae]|uniref:Uncharacterized protein n=1 Tax=Entomophthora muscae TaxID=34485 RepID=A0ACC2SSY8_9FUNG|nr:hypothetical protein DSO57_1019749 [Entomophthora muscae]